MEKLTTFLNKKVDIISITDCNYSGKEYLWKALF